jgi:hypothetical protein
MAADSTVLEQQIAAAQAAVQQQGDNVRALKASLKDGNAHQVSG